MDGSFGGNCNKPAWLLCAVALVASSIGCGEKAVRTGEVHGIVTFDEKPVTAGSVLFENLDAGDIGAAELDEQGQYEIVGLKLGEYVVSVAPLKGAVPNELSDFDGSTSIAATKVAKSKEIPSAYHNSQSSPLRHVIEEDESEYSFDLAR